MASLHVTAQDLSTFISPDSSFTLQYPSTWKSESDEYGPNRMTSFESPKKDENARRGDALFTISSQPLKKGITTLDAAVKPELNGLKKELKISSFIENKKVNDKQILVWQTKSGKLSLKSKTWMWIYKGRLYIAGYSSESQNYEANLKAGEAMFKSLKNI